MENKACQECAQTLPLSSFGTYKSKAGKLYHRSLCKKCQNKTPSDEVVEQRRQKALQEGFRECSHCRLSKSILDFPYHGSGRNAGYYGGHCKACTLHRSKAWAKENQDRVLEFYKSYNRKRRSKESGSDAYYRQLDANRAYLKLNPDVDRRKKARREAAKIQATVSWADEAKIRAVYSEAERLKRETGVDHHVDHIVPLRSRYVCGLHVQDNLTPLPREKNLEKGNRFWPDMPALDKELKRLAREHHAKTD